MFTNEGNLYVNDKVLKEGKAVLRGGELLLPFKEVMEKLGYHVTQSGDAVFIEKGSNRWRFFCQFTCLHERKRSIWDALHHHP